jgi:hypothetical protein
MMMRHHFMRPCKSWSLDHSSLFNKSCLVKNKSGLCVPVSIGPHKLGPNEHGQLVLMVNNLKNVERYQSVYFDRTVYRVFVLKNKAQVRKKMIISYMNFYYEKNNYQL